MCSTSRPSVWMTVRAQTERISLPSGCLEGGAPPLHLTDGQMRPPSGWSVATAFRMHREPGAALPLTGGQMRPPPGCITRSSGQIFHPAPDPLAILPTRLDKCRKILRFRACHSGIYVVKPLRGRQRPGRCVRGERPQQPHRGPDSAVSSWWQMEAFGLVQPDLALGGVLTFCQHSPWRQVEALECWLAG